MQGFSAKAAQEGRPAGIDLGKNKKAEVRRTSALN